MDTAQVQLWKVRMREGCCVRRLLYSLRGERQRSVRRAGDASAGGLGAGFHQHFVETTLDKGDAAILATDLRSQSSAFSAVCINCPDALPLSPMAYFPIVHAALTKASL